MRKDKIEAYIAKNHMRVTKERTKLIELICGIDVFVMNDFIKQAACYGISHGTVYLFVEMLSDAKILKRQESFVFKK